jgi:hypothetical protein
LPPPLPDALPQNFSGGAGIALCERLQRSTLGPGTGRASLALFEGANHLLQTGHLLLLLLKLDFHSGNLIAQRNHSLAGVDVGVILDADARRRYSASKPERGSQIVCGDGERSSFTCRIHGCDHPPDGITQFVHGWSAGDRLTEKPVGAESSLRQPGKFDIPLIFTWTRCPIRS